MQNGFRNKGYVMSKLAAMIGCLTLVSLGSISAEEAPEVIQNDMGYASMGLGPFPLPIPYLGIGYRLQRNHHGADVSLKSATVIHVTQLKGSALYHYYFSPNLSSQMYAGLGVGVSGVFSKRKDYRTYISPEFVVGKQYLNEVGGKRFFQAEVSWPTFDIRKPKDNTLVPLVVLSYGIGF